MTVDLSSGLRNVERQMIRFDSNHWSQDLVLLVDGLKASEMMNLICTPKSRHAGSAAAWGGISSQIQWVYHIGINWINNTAQEYYSHDD